MNFPNLVIINNFVYLWFKIWLCIFFFPTKLSIRLSPNVQNDEEIGGLKEEIEEIRKNKSIIHSKIQDSGKKWV